MGLKEGLATGVSGKFLAIREGKLVERSEQGAPGAVARQKKDGSTVYEIQHGSITGYLESVKVREHEEYGKFLRIQLRVKKEKFIIEMNLDSGYASSFLATIPSADLEGLIQISPSYTEKDGKKQSSMFLQQDSGWLKRFFTKDSPNGLPDLVKTKVKGKEVWDNSARLEFYEKMIQKLDAKLAEINKIEGDGQEEEAATAEAETEFSKGVKPPF